jgi:uncharacterized protein YkwD
MNYGKIAGTAWICAAPFACADEDSAAPRLGQPVSETKLEAVSPGELEQSTSAAAGDRLCASCGSNSECGAGNYCLRRSDGTRFCGRDCRSSLCPSSYSCVRVATTISQCVPRQGDCASLTSVGSDGGVRGDAGNDAGAVDGGAVDGGLSASDGATAPVLAGDVPGSAHCAAAAIWDPTWVGYENEVLRLSNQHRQAGAICGTVRYVPAAPLAMSAELRCAARLHSKDMSDRAYFSHTSPDGVSFSQRIARAGYDWRTAGENIASGYRSPQAVVDGWIRSAGHCQNLMNPSFTQIGVGFHGSYLWTQDFGAPF